MVVYSIFSCSTIFLLLSPPAPSKSQLGVLLFIKVNVLLLRSLLLLPQVVIYGTFFHIFTMPRVVACH